MTVVPARVAGVERIVVASPADRDGALEPGPARRGRPARGRRVRRRRRRPGDRRARLRPARGRPRPVDRIVGPGNAWVTAAKIEVCGEVGIDLPAGPSEGMVLAAPPADPGRVAADLITQAEHGPDSPGDPRHDGPRPSPTPSRRPSHASSPRAARRDILRPRSASTAGSPSPRRSTPRSTSSNAYAPEHLSVDVEPLEPTVARLRNAGSLFVGPWAPESAGDYATGANHVLPTGGLARGVGRPVGRGVRQVRPGPAGRPRRPRLASARPSPTLAEAEGLLAHRDAVEIRFEEPDPMSPTPVTFTTPTAPSTYSWEATDEEVAARYGLDPATIVRFDLNTSPTPPALVGGSSPPAGSRRRCPNTRRPTTGG